MRLQIIYQGQTIQIAELPDFDTFLQQMRELFDISAPIALAYQPEGKHQQYPLTNNQQINQINNSNISVKIFVNKEGNENQEYFWEKPKKGGEQSNAKFMHEDVSCSKCVSQPMKGTLWQCRSCPSCKLCSKCYKQKGNHDGQHVFQRVRIKQLQKEPNYREVIRLFFSNAHQAVRNNQEVGEFMGEAQFRGKGKKYQEQLAFWKSQYMRLMEQNIQKWQEEYELRQKEKI